MNQYHHSCCPKSFRAMYKVCFKVIPGTCILTNEDCYRGTSISVYKIAMPISHG